MYFWTQVEPPGFGLDAQAVRQLAYALLQGRHVYVRCGVPAFEDALFAAIRDALLAAYETSEITEEAYEAALARLYAADDLGAVPEGAWVVEVRAAEGGASCVMGLLSQANPDTRAERAAMR
ncbi:hypothetical protein [Alicyclobacillus vulcanalis]|uniref:Uncharacterized protein n=1 Tax=Alicyclobacillus vulcanalis TaxID=252246 RepID=A0A1N7KRV0_9BACL|nr:hypothetical protein [Alicyclobacillus vulcanalis]SIS64281.1 hypothetical protein SAMN05421799_102141 [Alicyclobacillus vulcanalis]